MAAEPGYDVAVVGGGINGVGVAQAAAAAGYSVVLLEKKKLAAGSSSKSSKLIHGGLRYLESLEFSLVHESLRERALLLQLAPDLVKLKPFYLPVYRTTRRPPWLVRTGLSLYAVLGRLAPAARFESIPKHRWQQLDGLITADLKAVFRYSDAQTNDALLTAAVMRSARDLGAELLMPARLVSAELLKAGCLINYQQGDDEGSLRARVLINAAGPWVNQVLATVSPGQKPCNIDLIQGTHIEVSGRLEHGIYYVEAPRDGRAVFVIPWGDHTMVGTTETRFRGDPDRAKPMHSEHAYLMRVLKHYFPRFSECRELNAWAGLRVLAASEKHAFHRSRETMLHCDSRDSRRPRLVSIYGGKLTTYRATAEKVMRLIATALPERKPRADTKRLPLEPCSDTEA